MKPVVLYGKKHRSQTVKPRQTRSSITHKETDYVEGYGTESLYRSPSVPSTSQVRGVGTFWSLFWTRVLEVTRPPLNPSRNRVGIKFVQHRRDSESKELITFLYIDRISETQNRFSSIIFLRFSFHSSRGFNRNLLSSNPYLPTVTVSVLGGG